MIRSDSRIPVLFVPLVSAVGDDAVLTDADAVVEPGRVTVRLGSAAGAHAMGCNCCVWRSSAAQAMTALFHARARGEVAFFRRLVVALPEAGVAEVRAALVEDRFVVARFRAA